MSLPAKNYYVEVLLIAERPETTAMSVSTPRAVGLLLFSLPLNLRPINAARNSPERATFRYFFFAFPRSLLLRSLEPCPDRSGGDCKHLEACDGMDFC